MHHVAVPVIHLSLRLVAGFPTVVLGHHTFEHVVMKISRAHPGNMGDSIHTCWLKMCTEATTASTRTLDLNALTLRFDYQIATAGPFTAQVPRSGRILGHVVEVSHSLLHSTTHNRMRCTHLFTAMVAITVLMFLWDQSV